MSQKSITAIIATFFCLWMLANTGCNRLENIPQGPPPLRVDLSIDANDQHYTGYAYHFNDEISVAALTPAGFKQPIMGCGADGESSLVFGDFPRYIFHEDGPVLEDENKTYEYYCKKIDNYCVYIVSEDEILERITYEELGLEKNYDSHELLREDMVAKIEAYLAK